MMTRSEQGKRTGAFFGRRKGHTLRPRQAALIDTLLPQLALDLSQPAPADLRALFDGVDDVRLESGFGGGEHLIAEAERHPRTGFIGIEPFVNGMAKALAAIDERKLDEHPPASRRRHRAAGLAAGREPRPLRSALSRSLAEAAALEAPLRAGRKRRRDRAHRAAGRRIPLRQRHRRLCGLDAGCGCSARPISPGPRSGPTTGGSRGRVSPARATRPRPSAKAACRAI